MPYEDDYKMWLEKMLIESNPNWVCDEMSNNEFTHNWCHQYCGEEDAYITPKCLHMYYHHIARADRKTENSSEIPNNCEAQTMYYPQVDGITPSVIVKDCTTCKYQEAVSVVCGRCDRYHSKYEPQTERPWGMYIDEHPMYE